MKKVVILFAVMLSGLSTATYAQNAPENVETPGIFDVLTDNSDTSKGVVILKQDPRLEQLVYKKKISDVSNKKLITTAGYRVQVYSSNQQRTAKDDAYKIQGKLQEKLPQYEAYVAYFSPFWKVRVGDCLSPTEAMTLRDEIKKEFPELAKEIYVVKDQVYVPEN